MSVGNDYRVSRSSFSTCLNTPQVCCLYFYNSCVDMRRRVTTSSALISQTEIRYQAVDCTGFVGLPVCNVSR